MPIESSILLVEGLADKVFFEHVCRKYAIETTVKVSVPTDWGGKYNTRGAVLNKIPLLIDQMRDGQVARLAIVVDSDLPEHGGGQVSTLRTFADLVGRRGFDRRQRVGERGGYLFSHKDGLHPIGLWMMPDNEQDGSIEHFIKSCVIEGQRERFQKSVILLDNSVKPFLFEPSRRIKAEVSGWLAWQAIPGQGIFSCIRDDLIDQKSEMFRRLEEWLLAVFH